MCGAPWSIPSDGSVEGETASGEVFIKNTPPSTPGVGVTQNPGASVPIQASITTPSTDPDGDPFTTGDRPRKLADKVIPFSLTRDAFPPLAARKGQVGGLTVTPRDDEAAGVAAVVTVKLVNTAPWLRWAPLIQPVEARTEGILTRTVELPR